MNAAESIRRSRFLPVDPMETERPSPRYSGIDDWQPADILDAMIEGQFSAVAAVRTAKPALERAALAMEARLRERGRLIYAGAGNLRAAGGAGWRRADADLQLAAGASLAAHRRRQQRHGARGGGCGGRGRASRRAGAAPRRRRRRRADRGGGERNHAIYARVPARGQAARSLDHRHRQQPRDAASRGCRAPASSFRPVRSRSPAPHA